MVPTKRLEDPTERIESPRSNPLLNLMPIVPCCCPQFAETSALCRRQGCHTKQGKAEGTKIAFGEGKWPNQ